MVAAMNQFIQDLLKKIKMNRFFNPAIAIVCLILVLLFSFTSPYSILKLTLYNINFRLKPATPQLNFLTLIDIDDLSLNSMGQFPWPRHYYAQGVDTLVEAGIRQTIFDIQFMDNSEPSVNRDLYKKLFDKTSERETVSRDDLKGVLIDNDKVLSASIKKAKGAIIPYSFSHAKIPDLITDKKIKAERDKAHQYFLAKASIPVPKDRIREFESLADRTRLQLAHPIPSVINSAELFGYVDADTDDDGVRRDIRLARVFEGNIYFNMGLVMVMNLCDVNMESVEIYPGKNIILKNAIDPRTYTKSDIVIPIDAKGKMLINWSAKEYMSDFNHIPFFALFEYPRVRDIAYEIFDAMESKSGNNERTGLSTEHHSLTSELAQITDKTRKYDKYIKIRKIENRLTEIETGFMNELKKNTELLNRFASDTGRKPEDLLTAMKITVETEKLKGHSCIISMTATSSNDFSLTPLSSHYMMPGKYPNIVNTILQGKFIHRVPEYLNIILMLLIAVGAGFIIPKFSSKAGVFTFVGTLIGVNVLIMLSFIFGNIWFDQLGISLAVLLPSLSLIGIKFIGEETEKRFIKSVFSRYLSPDVINEIIKDPEKLALGGEESDITIFFSDIAGFTSISEKLNPTQLVTLLNEYLTEMTDIILLNKGTIDKYEGDAIIAFFGAPFHYEDHAVKCCLASIDMQNRIRELSKIRRSRGQSEFFTRMGINTGRAVVGNMGSRTRQDYTMIGDAVNLAARLEGVNKVYKTAAMISEATYEKAKDHVEVRKLDTIRVVGKNEPIVIYELLERKGKLDDQTRDLLDKYYKGLDSFNDRDWKGAQKHFRDALKIKPEDGPSNLYVERCTEFLKQPPSKNWDGVYKMKSK